MSMASWDSWPVALRTHHAHPNTYLVSSKNKVPFLQDNNNIILEAADAKHTKELHVQELPLASQTANKASSLTHEATTLLNKITNMIQVCKICLENQNDQELFINSACSHSFCYECTSKYATIKIQEKNKTITCPELNCDSTLDYNALKLIIPENILNKWDRLLCESTIPESHKFYCPFTDCSVLLINDNSSLTQHDCPVCKRSSCAKCRVPWHSEFSCEEFRKLKTKKKGKEYDKMATALAKKNNWKKCPNCKFFVEKTLGCTHIRCRCKYDFCYTCGTMWTTNHHCRSLRSMLTKVLNFFVLILCHTDRHHY